jgi:hypothetical protein
MFSTASQKGGVVGENTESDCKELVVFYYLPESDCKELVGKWEPLVPYTVGSPTIMYSLSIYVI